MVQNMASKKPEGKGSKVTRQGRGPRNISAASGAPCFFLLSGFRDEKMKRDLIMKILALGARAQSEMVHTYVNKCTHVISCKPIRSEKYLCGVASGKWILKPSFITVSSSKGKWQSESKYEWNEDDVVCENVLPGLLTAPRRWREKIRLTGRGAFHGWKVLLRVTAQKNAVYTRVLEAGGGQCLSVSFPIKEPARLASLLTHVIVDKCFEKDVECLEAQGIHCLLPEAIAEHLFQETPNMAQYYVSAAEMTPTQAIKQSNVVISTGSSKKDHARGTPKIDTFLKPVPRTHSQGKHSSSSDGERDTPGSARGFGGGGSTSDTGRGVKRKLHFSPNQLREALQIVKKRKLSSQHLPLVPYTMTISRPKKSFQCASDDCPSVPFPTNLCNAIEGNIEEYHWLEALSFIGSSISTLYYPPPHIMYSMMQHILLSPSLSVCCSAVHILKQVLCLHSPACYPSLRTLYLDSMVPPPGIFKSPYRNEHFDFVDAVIRRALDGQRVIQDVKEHEDEEAVKVAMETGEMLLHFLVSLFEEDFMAAVRRKDAGIEAEKGVSRCMLARVLCPCSIEQASGKVPINVLMLMKRFIQAVKMADKCDDWFPVTNLLSTIMLMAAEIQVAFGEVTGSKNSDKAKKEFAEKLASTAKHEGVLKTRSCQELFLSMLKPSWLCLGVAECLLHNYDDQLLEGDRAFWADQPLTLRKIVSYYFYLVPPTAGPVMKDAREESPNTPLKTISNQQTLAMCSTGVTLKPSPRKTNVNRKNPKGETQLHVACIKNNLTRVRELLREPDIDMNARDNAGWTPLHEACNHGNISCVKELLKYAPGGKKNITSTDNKQVPTLDLLAAPSECGTTPLHDAVNNDQVEVVKLLVKAGGRALLTAKNDAGYAPLDLALTQVMKDAVLGQRSEVNGSPAFTEEEEDEEKLNSPQPHPRKYRQLLGPPSINTSGYVTEEECEAFCSIVMIMLQSYVRSHDLHRIKAEVDVIKGQKRVMNNLQMSGVNTSLNETTPFVSVVGAPTFSKAGLPQAPGAQDPVYTGTESTASCMNPLLEDMELFIELSRHIEGFKAHLRQIAPSLEDTTDTPTMNKTPVTRRVTRSMRLMTHLCAVVS